MTDTYAALHIHTEYSLLDGNSKLDDIVSWVHNHNIPAFAITDHGGLYGIPYMEQAVKNSGHDVKFIRGMEAYITHRGRTRHDKEAKIDERPFHLLLIAYNETGYKNLIKLTSIANTEGYYYRPRIDWETLELYNEGLFVTSTCLAGEIPRYIINKKRDKNQDLPEFKDPEKMIRDAMEYYLRVFKDRFFFEVQYRESSNDQFTVNMRVAELGKLYGVPVIATTDAHYVKPEDAEIHDTLLCMQTGRKKQDQDRMRFDEATYYIVEPEKMYHKFKDNPEFMTNTLLIAESVETWKSKTQYHIPHYPVPNGYNSSSFLRHLAYKGLQWRYAEPTSDLRKQLDYELSVFDDMGFNDYMLIVWDLTQFALHNDILYNTRGSAAGSLVSYCIGISNIDPIQQNLYFSRFLNKNRVTMPDIDLDIQDDKRNLLVQYAIKRYGSSNVSGIITFGTMAERGAIRDTMRVYDVPLRNVDEIISVLPDGVSLNEAATNTEFMNVINKHNAYDYFVEAVQLVGTPRNTSTHAAGIIITPDEISNYVPLHRGDSKKLQELGIDKVTQWDMGICEEKGLLKVDFLGSSTLREISLACKLINQRHGTNLNFENIPYRHNGIKENDDAVDASLKMISEGHTVGIFQLESEGITEMFKKMKPVSFENIVAGISLYRPGPLDFVNTYIDRMHGKEKIDYLHEKLEPILAETYGIMVYQENLIKISIDLFDYNEAEGDMLRRAISKKKNMEDNRNKFMENAPRNGISPEKASEIFDVMVAFANYGFNKAHAAAYARVTMATAFLKTFYPNEYMVTHLNTYIGKDRITTMAYDEVKRLGITLLQPSINHSDLYATLEGDDAAIRIGLTMIKGVGEAPSKLIKSQAPYEDLDDMAYKLNLSKVHRGAFENMILAGVFDELYHDRSQLLAELENLRNYSDKLTKGKSKKQMSFFDDDKLAFKFTVDDYKVMSKADLLATEFDLMFTYLSGDPNEEIRQYFKDTTTIPISQLIDVLPNDNKMLNNNVRVGGVLTEVIIKQDKKGKDMVFATLKDYRNNAPISITLFSSEYDKHRNNIFNGAVLIVEGKFQYGYNRYSILPNKLIVVNKR